jgi:hypothetical protein
MGSADIIIGRVDGVHIADTILTDGMVDVKKTMPIARCGYWQYAIISETFEMVIPGDPLDYKPDVALYFNYSISIFCSTGESALDWRGQQP